MDRIIQSRHQFIYGYNGDKRKEFLKNIASKNPIVLDKDQPGFIYLEDFSLPNTSPNTKNAFQLSSISREFLNFEIAYSLLINSQTQIGKRLLDERADKLLSAINRLFLNKSFEDIKSLDELISILKDVRNFYQEKYIQLSEESKLNIGSLPIPFIDIEAFVNYFKKMLNNNSYFGLIFDQQKKIPTISQQAINGIITRRINHNLSVKVASQPNEWNYLDLNGLLAESVHDYGTVVIDECFGSYTKSLKR